MDSSKSSDPKTTISNPGSFPMPIATVLMVFGIPPLHQTPRLLTPEKPRNYGPQIRLWMPQKTVGKKSEVAALHGKGGERWIVSCLWRLADEETERVPSIQRLSQKLVAVDVCEFHPGTTPPYLATLVPGSVWCISFRLKVRFGEYFFISRNTTKQISIPERRWVHSSWKKLLGSRVSSKERQTCAESMYYQESWNRPRNGLALWFWNAMLIGRFIALI